MKYFMLLLVFLTGLSGFSQDGNPKKMRDSVVKFTPEQSASLKAKKLTLALDLSEEQQRKVEQLELERARDRQQMREAKRTERKEQAHQRESEERYAHISEKMDKRIAFNREMKSILSEAQYLKWQTLSENHGKKRQRRHGRKSREHPPRHAH